jgi:PAS domain S-box-containing protein
MEDRHKTKAILMEELNAARRRVAELEDAASMHMHAEKAPRESAELPRETHDIAALELSDIIDVPPIQSLMQDFYQLTHMALAILDLNGNVLIAIGWQDICTSFHRVHPQAAMACTESDLFLAQNLRQGEFVAYKCKNGLWDVVTPLFVGGKHVGNIYTGQFFYEDETIDREAFIAQADRYGFDRESYLHALHSVPRYSRDTVNALMHFLTKLSVYISELSLSNLELAHTMSEQQRMAETLRKSQQEYRNLFENAVIGIFRSRLDGSKVLEVNQALADLLGYTREEMLSEPVALHWADHKARDEMIERLNKDGAIMNFEADIRTKNGQIRQCLVSVRLYPLEGYMEGTTIDITERKRSERLLRESEERFRLITDNITDIVFTTDTEGRYTFISPSHQRALARGEEVLGKSIFEFIHPDDKAGVAAAFRKGVQDRVIVRAEHRYLHPSRGYIWLESEGKMIDMLGSPTGVIVSRDITSRKQAEIALRESEERYRQLFQSMVNGFALHDIICDENGAPRDYRFLEVNPAFEEMTGMKSQTVIGKTVREIMPDIESSWIDLYGQVALTGNPIHFENFSGALNKYFEVSAYSPKHGQFAAVFVDITERKRTEERLMNEMEFVSTLLETIPSPIFFKDNTGRYLGCNRAFEEFWGRSKEDVIGRHVHDMGPREITEKYVDMDNELFEKGGLQTYEWKVKVPDGSEKEVIFNKAAFMDSTGKIAGLVGVILDITERKKAEDEKQRLQVQLSQAQKMESIGTLAGGIAHDFNNILSAVLGFAELAKFKAGGGEDVKEDLDEVLKAGVRARDLVRQILMFSRQAEITREPLQISPLIKETLKFLRASLPSTIEFRYDLEAPGSLVMADPVQIHQIIMNLCTNAAHAMREKGGTLDIGLAEVVLDDAVVLEYKGLQPGRYVRLSVTDTGRGIPKEIIHRIFDPFFTTKERGEGTGLGLSVVHGIVKDMGGAVSVYSEPGQGTRFNILLPLYEGVADEAYALNADMKMGIARILFVDDEEGVIASGRGILEHLGYQITATTSPGEAMELFSAHPEAFDLVLTDMTMPRMTGIELAEEFHKIRSNIPIVLCTGFSLGLSPQRIQEAGIREMVMKPMVASELSEAVYRALHPADG